MLNIQLTDFTDADDQIETPSEAVCDTPIHAYIEFDVSTGFDVFSHVMLNLYSLLMILLYC